MKPNDEEKYPELHRELTEQFETQDRAKRRVVWPSRFK